MSYLFMVRHGQASFLSDDYDKLSPLGMDQSRRLGEYWVRHGLTFHRVIAGPRRRHRETAEGVREAYVAAGLPFPELEIRPGFDEFQADEMVSHSITTLSGQYQEIKDLHLQFLAAPTAEEKSRTFQKFMEVVTRLWARAEFHAPGLEPWTIFETRVHAALDALIAESPRGSRVAVFTSGGPAALSVQRALCTAPEKTLELIWTLRNAALVEFLYTHDRFTLSTFNTAPHLETSEFWTYR